MYAIRSYYEREMHDAELRTMRRLFAEGVPTDEGVVQFALGAVPFQVA